MFPRSMARIVRGHTASNVPAQFPPGSTHAKIVTCHYIFIIIITVTILNLSFIF